MNTQSIPIFPTRIPRVIGPADQIDVNTISAVFTAFAGRIPLKVIQDLLEAIRDNSVVVCSYKQRHKSPTPMCLFPDSLYFTRNGKLICRAYSTRQRMWGEFRCDRLFGTHLLSTPEATIV